MEKVNQSVSLSIEELVLEGISPIERHTVAEAFQLELQQLLTERGVPPRLVMGMQPTPTVVNQGNLGPARLGRSIALALYEGWQ